MCNVSRTCVRSRAVQVTCVYESLITACVREHRLAYSCACFSAHSSCTRVVLWYGICKLKAHKKQNSLWVVILECKLAT